MKSRFAFFAAMFVSLACHAQGLAERCDKLAREARIQVVFEDRAVTRDDSRSQDMLKRLSQNTSNPYHRVLGLTHAEPTSRWSLSTQAISDPGGRTCIVPSVSLQLGFSGLTVYIARELADGCRRAIVLAHEQEHVAIWRNHFRVAARLLSVQLQDALGQPAYFDNLQQAEEGMRVRVQALIDRQLQNLTTGIQAAHQQIDSPGSYQLEEGRLRGCP